MGVRDRDELHLLVNIDALPSFYDNRRHLVGCQYLALVSSLHADNPPRPAHPELPSRIPSSFAYSFVLRVFPRAPPPQSGLLQDLASSSRGTIPEAIVQAQPFQHTGAYETKGRLGLDLVVDISACDDVVQPDGANAVSQFFVRD